MLHIHELQRNITKDYRKLVVNKFYDRILLPDGCMCFEVGGQAANSNWDLAGCLNQPLRSTMCAWGHCRIRTDSGHVSNCRARSVLHPTTTKSWQRIYKCRKSVHNLIRGTHVAIHGNHQTAPEGESLLHWILTAYVTWAHLYEPALKRQSTEWHHQATTCPQKYQQEQVQL